MTIRRGMVVVESGGKDYVIRFGMNQVAAAEERFGMPFGKIIERLDVEDGRNLRFSDVRNLLSVSTGLKLDEAGDMMDDVGISEITEKLGQAIKAAFPDSGGSDEGNGEGQKAT